VTDAAKFSSDFVFRECIAENNYRQGMSIINARNFIIEGGEYRGTNGTAPQAGIDVESNSGAVVPGNARGRFVGVKFTNNAGYGLLLSDNSGAEDFIVEGAYFSGNKLGAISVYTNNTFIRNSDFTGHGSTTTRGIVDFAASQITHAALSGSRFTNNYGSSQSVYIHSKNFGITIENNSIKGGGAGIVNYGPGSVLRGNLIEFNEEIGINNNGPDTSIIDNKITSSKGRGIYNVGPNSKISRNYLRDIVGVSLGNGYIEDHSKEAFITGNILESSSMIPVNAIFLEYRSAGVFDNTVINLKP
jgi:hypothetical protein